MASKLHQNAIITGCVDSFCLVCESHLWSEGDALSHIEKPVHSKNLSSYPYLEKFTDDHIRKVNKGYFCEFCNVLLPTSTKVGLHIKESSHNDNKGIQLIKRFGSNILVSDNILITEQAWNGIIVDTCAVCNLEFKNLKLHIAEQKHVLNLIQKKVEFSDGNMVYRKIDDSSFHCLICNNIFSLETVSSHYKDEIHETNANKCRKFYQASSKNNKNEKSANEFQNGADNCVNHIIKKDTVNNEKGISSHDVNNVDKELKISNTKNNPKSVGNNRISTDINPTNKNANTKNAINGNKQHNETTKTNSGQKENIATGTQSGNAILVNKDVSQTKKTKNNTKNAEKVNKSKIYEYVTEFQKNGVNINFETETAFCKRCFENIDLNVEVIQQHIAEHKINPKKETANTAPAMNQTHSKTVLNSKEKDDNKAVNFDLNHNVTYKTQESVKEKEEEIIKIDIRKDKDIEESESHNAVARYVPDTATAKQNKEETTSKAAEKDSKNINDPEEFAKQNDLTYNKGNGNAFCRICSTRVPACIQNMKEHVAGMPHKTKRARLAEIEKAANVIPKKPMSKFIDNISTVRNIFGVDDVILNDKICLSRLSFLMITTTQKRLRCQACEVNLREADVSRHLDGESHERAMEVTPVVTSLDSEFIREVRTGLYHCGYCNLIVGGWDDVHAHVRCGEHAARAREASGRLRAHLPKILEHRAHREMMFFRAAIMHHFSPFF